jgi:hypothetical protein
MEFRAVTKGAVLGSTHVGTVRDIQRDSTLNIDFVHLGASCLTIPVLQALITGLIDSPGDSGGAVSFRFVPRDFTNANSTSPNSSGRRLAFFI